MGFCGFGCWGWLAVKGRERWREKTWSLYIMALEVKVLGVFFGCGGFLREIIFWRGGIAVAFPQGAHSTALMAGKLHWALVNRGRQSGHYWELISDVPLLRPCMVFDSDCTRPPPKADE